MPIGFDRIDIDEGPYGKIVTLVIRERLEKKDYERFVPQLETMISSGNPIRLLVILQDFRSMSPGAMWEDLKFDARHFNDIDRLAIVGDRFLEKALTSLFQPFTRAEVRFFEQEELDQANDWIRQSTAG